MDRLKSILKDSSLANTMSDLEIDEIVEEIRPDFDDYLEEEKERIEEEAGVDELNDEIEELKEQIQELKAIIRNRRTVNDQITDAWINENWEHIVKLQQMNLTGEEIFNKFCKC